MIWKTSLDSRIGIFHAANKRHYSLNLDFADLFKPIIVDRIIFALINRGQISEKHFAERNNKGIYLNEAGKRIFIDAFQKKMDSKLVLPGSNKSVRYYNLLEYEIRKYLRHILDGEKYKPYKYY